MSGGGISRIQELGHLKNYISVSVDFTNATWNITATHEVLTITGLVRVQIIPECTESLAAGIGATMALGFDNGVTGIVGATAYTLITNGALFLSTTPALDFSATGMIDKVVNGSDFGYQIAVNALTDGTINFHCYWEPLNQNAPGTVVAGAGGTL